MVAVDEPTIVGRGTPEQVWLQSSALERMQTVSVSQLIGKTGRLVVISPHPDDEVLGCGGLMSLAAIESLPVLIIAVTDGEHCYPQHPRWGPEALRSARSTEVLNALEALHLDAFGVARLSLPDGALMEHIDGLTDCLLSLLSPEDVVLAPLKCDGHPDHEATYQAAFRATKIVDCRLLQYPVWAWHWMKPGSIEFGALNTRRLALPREIQQRKRTALSCFTTQTGRGRPEIEQPILLQHVMERFQRSFEVFII